MPELEDKRVVAHGSYQDICDYLNCSRATLQRRLNDSPELFVRIGRCQLLLVLPSMLAEQFAQAV